VHILVVDYKRCYDSAHGAENLPTSDLQLYVDPSQGQPSQMPSMREQFMAKPQSQEAHSLKAGRKYSVCSGRSANVGRCDRTRDSRSRATGSPVHSNSGTKSPYRQSFKGDSVTAITDAVRIRVIRALLGMSCRKFADALNVSTASLTGWEKGRSVPRPRTRQELAKLCQKHGIAFMPSGFPIPVVDCMLFKKEVHNG